MTFKIEIVKIKKSCVLNPITSFFLKYRMSSLMLAAFMVYHVLTFGRR